LLPLKQEYNSVRGSG